MNTFQNIRTWGDAHQAKLLSVIRIFLGVFLFMKGAIFYSNLPYLRDLILENKLISQSSDLIEAIIYYVVYVHLVGGALIVVGLYTRILATLQLPIIFGAIFFVNITARFINSELWLAVLVLALLCLFIIIGSGPLSIDKLVKNLKIESDDK